MLRKLFIISLSILGFEAAQAQLVSVTPIFPKENDSVTIVFDATKGNAGLVGETQVYAHTGVITNLSTSSTDWKHVVGNWGTADARVKMTSLGNNLWSLKFHMKNFYAQAGAFGSNETIQKMAFVFRNTTGSKKGANTDGSDIFIQVFDNAFATKLVSPLTNTVLISQSDSVIINAWSSQLALLKISVNDTTKLELTSAENLTYILKNLNPGEYKVQFTATYGMQTQSQTVTVVVNPVVQTKFISGTLEQGATIVNDSTVTFALYAPNKQNVYVLLEQNQYAPRIATFMDYDPSKSIWWKTIKLTPGENGYQYLVDGDLRVADPFSTVILNQWDDGYIPTDVYPNLKPYPSLYTSGNVSLINTTEIPYNWEATNYNAPHKEKLVIYELLIRDFVGKQSFKTLQDSIPYLKRFGINAIELMPVTEFEGNLSWGYNVSHHMALDKYYGTRLAFKQFIDECHKNGIAVIMDVVYNHAFSTSPICQLYWDASTFKPTPQNPWLNPDAKHPFNVGYDLNHESSATNYYVKQSLKYWLQEFKIDGFRFDLSKGFTQRNSGSDVAYWGQYDAGRVSILKDYNSFITYINPNAYVILEHFGSNDEEKELSAAGMMLWGNGNKPAAECVMSYLANSDYGWAISPEHRGWGQRHIVGYLESHDEERLAYKAQAFGTALTKQKNIYTQRSAAAHALFLLTPGPKLIWQFGELGYDYSINRCPNGTINDACRVDNKPIKWDYWTNDTSRQKTYYTLAAINYLKTQHNAAGWPVDYDLNASGQNKSLTLWHTDFNTFVISNMGTEVGTFPISFPSAGRWYNYLKGDSLNLAAAATNITIPAHTAYIFTSKYVQNPYLKQLNRNATVNNAWFAQQVQVFPNPATKTVNITVPFAATYTIYSMQGSQLLHGNLQAAQNAVQTHTLGRGMYILQLSDNQNSASQVLIIE